MAATSLMHSRFHEVACSKCRLKMYLPAWCYAVQSSQANCMCFIAAFRSCSTSSLGLVKSLGYCHMQNSVHGGYPIKHIGCCSSRIFLAALPLVSTVEPQPLLRSMAKPGISP